LTRPHTVLVYLRLHRDRLTNYFCPAKHVLGVNMIYLFKLVKTMGNNDSLTLLSPANNPNKLGIRMENSEKSTTTNYFLGLQHGHARTARFRPSTSPALSTCRRLTSRRFAAI
jgi:hypothetical protein